MITQSRYFCADLFQLGNRVGDWYVYFSVCIQLYFICFAFGGHLINYFVTIIWYSYFNDCYLISCVNCEICLQVGIIWYLSIDPCIVDKTFREKSEKDQIWQIVHPFWALTLEQDFCLTCGFRQKKRINGLYWHAENQENL